MSAGLEVIAAEEWILGALSDSQIDTLLGASGKVYLDLAPDGTPSPWIVVQMQATTDLRGIGTIRVMADTLFVVKAVGSVAGYAALKPIALRIDQLLHGMLNHTVTDGQMIGCVRERHFQMTEVTQGRQYRHLGGVYRIYSQ